MEAAIEGQSSVPAELVCMNGPRGRKNAIHSLCLGRNARLLADGPRVLDNSHEMGWHWIRHTATDIELQ